MRAGLILAALAACAAGAPRPRAGGDPAPGISDRKRRQLRFHQCTGGRLSGLYDGSHGSGVCRGAGYRALSGIGDCGADRIAPGADGEIESVGEIAGYPTIGVTLARTGTIMDSRTLTRAPEFCKSGFVANPK